jgi:hypothetical protein
MKSKKTAPFRDFLVIALLSCYVLTSFRMLMPFINYKINYKYISEVLCINKAKPKMACNGKCHLKKQLKATAATQEKENKSFNFQFQSENWFQTQVFVATSPYFLQLISFQLVKENTISLTLALNSPPPQV